MKSHTIFRFQKKDPKAILTCKINVNILFLQMVGKPMIYSCAGSGGLRAAVMVDIAVNTIFIITLYCAKYNNGNDIITV